MKFSNLEIALVAEDVPLFTSILQWGIVLQSDTGIALGDFLITCPGFSSKYLEDTVQTVFFNGMPVDDMQIPLMEEKTVIALSAAMPGLAGAIFRKQGIHQSLRTRMMPQAEGKMQKEKIQVVLKLFNQIAREKGPLLLVDGVSVSRAALCSFFSLRRELAWRMKSLYLDGNFCSPDSFFRMLEENAGSETDSVWYTITAI